jgi:hypothetical protein
MLLHLEVVVGLVSIYQTCVVDELLRHSLDRLLAFVVFISGRQLAGRVVLDSNLCTHM